MLLDPSSPGAHICVRPVMDIEMKLQPTLQAPGLARRFVARELDALGYPQLVEDARLMASELVTNAITYVPRKPLWVAIQRMSGYVVLEVWDGSSEPPVPQDPDFLAQGGRGFQVIGELGIRFGYDIFCCGKVVWVTLLGDPHEHRGQAANEGNERQCRCKASSAVVNS
jgi:anti-sigma regulatory factor (Ser/Thr protein kinase)